MSDTGRPISTEQRDALLQGVEAAVFDFGGVLVDLDRGRCVEAFRALGVDVAALMGQYHQCGVLSDLERGAITMPQFFAAVRDLAGRPELTSYQIGEAWDKFLLSIPARRLDCLLRLRKTYRLYLLSNTNVIHWMRARNDLFLYKGHTVQDFFRHTFLSYEMGMEKPHEDIFQTMLQEAELKPEATLFIDDSSDNCAAAAKLGLRVFCPQDGDDWLKLFPSQS